MYKFKSFRFRGVLCRDWGLRAKTYSLHCWILCNLVGWGQHEGVEWVVQSLSLCLKNGGSLAIQTQRDIRVTRSLVMLGRDHQSSQNLGWVCAALQTEFVTQSEHAVVHVLENPRFVSEEILISCLCHSVCVDIPHSRWIGRNYAPSYLRGILSYLVCSSHPGSHSGERSTLTGVIYFLCRFNLHLPPLCGLGFIITLLPRDGVQHFSLKVLPRQRRRGWFFCGHTHGRDKQTYIHKFSV